MYEKFRALLNAADYIGTVTGAKMEPNWINDRDYIRIDGISKDGKEKFCFEVEFEKVKEEKKDEP